MNKPYERTPKIREKMRIATLDYLQDHPSPMLGKKLSAESRKKMSDAMLRRLQKLRDEGKPHFLVGKKHSAERSKKQSITMKGRYAGSRHPNWKGGRKTSLGYIYVLAPGHPGANSFGYIREHRLVMEKMIGRLLKPSEVVHHKNRDKTDNRPENLVLFGNHKDHSNFRESQKVCPHCGGRL
jgi:hypothetical protein